jgi:protein-disulfide isomerase
MQNSDQKPIVSAIIIAGALIAGAILLKGNTAPSPENLPTANNGVPTATLRPVSKSDHILGNINAKIVIVGYSDLECPYCKVFHDTMHKVVTESNGSVAWVFRHFPIPQLHSKAFREAEATECAYAQGGDDAFWRYTDRLFEITPSNNGLNDSELPKIAEYIGLNVGAFSNCLEGRKFTGKVQADIDDGVKAGVNGTPSSFILQRGKIIDNIPGAQPFEAVMQRLDAIK